MAIVISAFLMFLGFTTLAVGSTLSSIFVVTAGLFLLEQVQVCAMWR